MNAPKKLKEILDAIATKFGVAKARVWKTVERNVSGFGTKWNARLYVEREATADEAKQYNLPPGAILLSFEGETKPCLALYPSTYKDGNQVERTTVCASSIAYLKKVGMKKIDDSDWEPDSDIAKEPDEEDRQRP